MRIDSGPVAALLLSLAALAGCGLTDWTKVEWAKPEDRAFADSDKRCSQVAMKAAPINEAQAVGETSLARRQAYSDCMARPGG